MVVKGTGASALPARDTASRITAATLHATIPLPVASGQFPAASDCTSEGRADVGLAEIVPHEEQRVSGYRGRRIGEAVTEVQSRGVTAAPIPVGRVQRPLPLGLSEGDHRDAQ